MRQSYGQTWWGQRWLQALDRIDFSNRLPRGRTYANKGAVRDIAIRDGRISAKVQGTQPRPYKVEVQLPPLNAAQRAKVIQVVAENPFFLSKLLNRELPPALQQACEKAGVQVFPSSWKDVQGSCSCPDWAIPCKHLAAVLYLVANEIDKNPFLAFELRGFDLLRGLESIGYHSGGEAEVAIARLKDLYGEARPELSVLDPEAPPPDLSRIPDCRADWMKLLKEKPVFYPQGDFKEILGRQYYSLSRQLSKYETPAPAPEAPDYSLAETITLELDAEGEFMTATVRDGRHKEVTAFKQVTFLINWLDAVPHERLPYLSAHFQGLYQALRLARKLVTQSAYLPQILQVSGPLYAIRWVPALLREEVREQVERLAVLLPADVLHYQVGREERYPAPNDRITALLSFFLNHFVWNYAELAANDPVNELFFTGAVVEFEDFTNREYPSAIHLWLNRLFLTEQALVPVLQIEEAEDGFELSVAVARRDQPLEPPRPLDVVFGEAGYAANRLALLRDLATLSDHFPDLSRLIASGGRETLLYDSRAFPRVLLELLPTIQLMGIKVQMPRALRRLLRPQIGMLLEGEDNWQMPSGIISLEQMLRFRWQGALGDELIDQAEFKKLLEKYRGIIKWRDQYVYFDEKEMGQLLDKLEHPPTVTPAGLLEAALTGSYAGATVQLDTKARALLDKLLSTGAEDLPEGLQAILRPYQERGYSWLYKNARLGFGSLIADDMGLGKTLQVIATLLRLQQEGRLGERPALVVAPTTLLTNWQREIARFAPTLRTYVYHGPSRQLPEDLTAEVMLTTYGIARSDEKKLSKASWPAVVIDEAQAIKNPAAAQTKAVKKLSAPVRIAMSGTPVENRLQEYWSILDFANHGYLGSQRQFNDNFAKPIEQEQNQEQLDRFRRLTAPFILRRLKTDQSIIQDLPDKIEKEEYCNLTPEQASLYQSLVDHHLQDIADQEGIQRAGLIFKLMTALKQICNHPAHYLKTGAADWEQSGKTLRLRDLLHAIFEQDEKVLLFTQYREMGDLLVPLIQREFHLPDVPFLHGGRNRKQRDEMVEDFQHNRATRILLLSLKAGGTGLNLTAASRVLHFDLWWNPAVEQQATDRAFRIGQQRNVFVHRFLTEKTFEEKINLLLQSKKDLADRAVATGEKWVGELSNAELKELVSL